MPSTHRANSPLVQAAARLPAYIVLALLAVAVTAGGLLAARGESPPAEPEVVNGDVTETALPTPVPLESATPLPTPVPMGQAATADTAVAFWMEWVPEEVSEEFSQALVAAFGPRPSWLASPASPGPTPVPAPPAPETDSTAVTPSPTPLATLLPVPLPTTVLTPAPLPVPLPSDPITIIPTLPPLLP